MSARRAARRCVLAALALVAVAIVAGCGGGSDELTIYSGRIEPLIGPAIKLYEKDSGEKVKVRYGDSPSLAATLVEEGKNSRADLFYAQDAGSLDAIEKAGNLERLPPDILAKVPARFRSRDGRWIGVTARSRIIAYGPKIKASEVPESPLDLADKKWRGRVGWAPTNASLQGYITALRLVEGEDVARKWLKGMVANKTQVFDSNVPVRDAIAKGELDLGLINHYYVAEAQAKDPNYPVKVHFPTKDLGSLVNVSGVGVLASSKHRKESIDFVRTMLERPAQEYFADSSKEYPLLAGVKRSKELTPLNEIPSPKVDLANLGDLKGTLKLMRETGAL
ncbi:MAG TPA: iron ABC transporter substrate-binding protein [Solirubrobacteraceae bacterium]|jgi:iron(III) transport system substrate-binding protein|nr:iron ABC transporter substrate-binding protein [Solirubrobacteraceae bacterium]